MTIHRIAATRRALLASATLLILSGPAIGADAPRVKFATSMGDFVVELYPDKAPRTVENFLQYVRDKHYDGTIFPPRDRELHGAGRRIRCTTLTEERKSRSPIQHEGRDALDAGGPAQRRRNASPWPVPTTRIRPAPSSSSTSRTTRSSTRSSFRPAIRCPEIRIPGARCTKTRRSADLLNAPQLYGYTVFGKVISGMDVIMKMKSTPTVQGRAFPDRRPPQSPFVINSATLVK
jgi:peptidyl-prolyl cis-trans isomerase A (cyclophilin A)